MFLAIAGWWFIEQLEKKIMGQLEQLNRRLDTLEKVSNNWSSHLNDRMNMLNDRAKRIEDMLDRRSKN